MKLLTASLIVILALPLLTGAQQIAHPQPVTSDLSHGAVFKFRIAPNLPEFTFKMIPNLRPVDEYGNPQTTVRQVRVFRGDSTQPVQTLEGCEFQDMEAPPRDSDWFRAEDMNFDGYKDIYLLTMWGATGNEFGCVWLYDSQTARFEFEKTFSELGTITLHPATKTITTFGNGGMAGTVFRAAKYAVEHNRPVPLITVVQDFDTANNRYHCVVQQRQGDGLVSTRDLWSAPGSDPNAAPPCDPVHPFKDTSQ